MNQNRWIAIAALLAAVGVGLGAFGAHGLKERLLETDQLENWHTAVRYQMWHALALLAWVALRDRRSLSGATGWCFLVGTLLFSGSIYGLALGGPGAVLGPITPLGGALLIFGWVVMAVSALRADESGS
jgi:uncharacterized membrane protein YgdD (TMEM256/DUF423 family)